jgi:outer membrane lipoprotein
MKHSVPVILLAALLAGCASPVPKVIREPLPGEIGVAQARADLDAHIGKRVRWGGSIVKVENRPKETVIELVSRPLGDRGRPRDTDRSGGRFLASFQGFLDPAIYAKGRELTVVGTLADSVSGAIGEHPYRFPLVRVESFYLWEPLPPPYPYYYDPFWYDPFWDPFWPSPWYRFRPWRYPYWW